MLGGKVDEFLEHLLEDASMDASGLKKLNDDQLNELIEAVESWRSNFETRGGDEGQKLLDVSLILYFLLHYCLTNEIDELCILLFFTFHHHSNESHLETLDAFKH